MKVRKILIVPGQRLVNPVGPMWKRLGRTVRDMLRKSGHVLSAEIQFYGDLPTILGEENVYIYGTYKKYITDSVPEDSPYPSCYNTPTGSHIEDQDLENIVRKVDVMLVSTNGHERTKRAIDLAKKHDIPVAMIDFRDQMDLPIHSPSDEALYRSFVPGKDFQLFFKKEVPLSLHIDILRPLSPFPVRPSNYDYGEVSKDKTVFYSGRARPTLCHADRVEAVEGIKMGIDNHLICEHDTQSTFLSMKEYRRNFSRSLMALSPSGRSWDSFRHCEIALPSGVLLIAPKPYIQTVGPQLKDGVNALLYDVVLGKDMRYHLANRAELIEKIQYYLNNEEKRSSVARQWQEDVLNGHTITARSKYILSEIEHFF